MNLDVHHPPPTATLQWCCFWSTSAQEQVQSHRPTTSVFDCATSGNLFGHPPHSKQVTGQMDSMKACGELNHFYRYLWPMTESGCLWRRIEFNYSNLSLTSWNAPEIIHTLPDTSLRRESKDHNYPLSWLNSLTLASLPRVWGAPMTAKLYPGFI